MNRTAYIYALCEPDNGSVRYIGWTLYLEKRYRRHLKDLDPSKSVNPEKAKWVRALLRAGKTPYMLTIEVCDENTWAEREKYWIAEYRRRGAKLLNIAEGGSGGIAMAGENNPMYGKKRPELAERNRNNPPTKGKKRPEHAEFMKSLGDKHPMHNPDVVKKVFDKIRGKKNAGSSNYMKKNNPMKDPAILEKRKRTVAAKKAKK